MLVVLIIVSAGLLGLIIYFAVSPKSSRLLKLVALAALVLIVLSIGICSVILIRGPGEDPNAMALPIFQDAAPTPAKKGNLPAILIFLLVFVVILGMIVLIAQRDNLKKSKPEKKDVDSIFEDADAILGTDKPDKEKDDSFDIDFK